ncbi:MAG: hypothetical protein EPO00_12765 [Chloroflexota bacterium]|nr:MAG: hypothetical protein EPO00_12765 [Chloroflexota bacterium]
MYEATLTGEGRPAAISSPTPAAHRDDGHHREFVPVELTREHAPEREPGQQARIGPTPGTTFSVAPEPARPDASIQPVTLFHDLDR